MFTKGQRRRLGALRRRQATRRLRTNTTVKLNPMQLSKTARTRLKYAAGPEIAKIFTKKPSASRSRTRKMAMNNAGTATRGSRTSSRVAGATPQYIGLVNRPRAPRAPGLSENNLTSLLAKFSGLKTTNY